MSLRGLQVGVRKASLGGYRQGLGSILQRRAEDPEGSGSGATHLFLQSGLEVQRIVGCDEVLAAYHSFPRSVHLGSVLHLPEHQLHGAPAGGNGEEQRSGHR